MSESTSPVTAYKDPNLSLQFAKKDCGCFLLSGRKFEYGILLKTRQDNTRQDKPRQDKTRKEKRRQGETTQGETTEDKARQYKTR